MSESTIAPFRDLTSKRKAEKEGSPTDTIAQLLAAIEGMQDQIKMMTDLIVSIDARINQLEAKDRASKIIKLRNGHAEQIEISAPPDGSSRP